MNPQSNSETSTNGAGASVDTPEDFGPGKAGQAKRWKAELDSAKRTEKTFISRAETRMAGMASTPAMPRTAAYGAISSSSPPKARSNT